jgi:hypothetical protein
MIEQIDEHLEPVWALLEMARKPLVPYQEAIYAPVMPVANAFGRPLDEVIMFIGILLGFVLQACMPLIRSPALRKWFSTIMGMAVTVYVYGA